MIPASCQADHFDQFSNIDLQTRCKEKRLPHSSATVPESKMPIPQSAPYPASQYLAPPRQQTLIPHYDRTFQTLKSDLMLCHWRVGHFSPSRVPSLEGESFHCHNRALHGQRVADWFSRSPKRTSNPKIMKVPKYFRVNMEKRPPQYGFAPVTNAYVTLGDLL